MPQQRCQTWREKKLVSYDMKSDESVGTIHILTLRQIVTGDKPAMSGYFNS